MLLVLVSSILTIISCCVYYLYIWCVYEADMLHVNEREAKLENIQNLE